VLLYFDGPNVEPRNPGEDRKGHYFTTKKCWDKLYEQKKLPDDVVDPL